MGWRKDITVDKQEVKVELALVESLEDTTTDITQTNVQHKIIGSKMNIKSRVFLSNSFKINVLDSMNSQNDSVASTAKKFNLKRRTLRSWVRNEESIRRAVTNGRQKSKTSKIKNYPLTYPELDKKLSDWVRDQALVEKVSLRGIRKKAKIMFNTLLEQKAPEAIKAQGKNKMPTFTKNFIKRLLKANGLYTPDFIIFHKKEIVEENEKYFSCHDCEFKSLSVGGLKYHTLSHTGERPFICAHCGRTFKRKAELMAHTRIHMGDKIFQCKECDYSCTDASNLVKHTRNVHKICA